MTRAIDRMLTHELNRVTFGSNSAEARIAFAEYGYCKVGFFNFERFQSLCLTTYV